MKIINLDILNLNKMNRIKNNIYPCDSCLSNGRYGHAYHLKKYAGIDTKLFLNCVIEHGLDIVHGAVYAFETNCNPSTVLTLSQYRKTIIEKYVDVEAIPIGPYIAYSNSYYNEKIIKKTKKKYGHTLLVFPSHCAEIIKNSYDLSEFLAEIKRVSKKFDTVIVCLYYLDINKKLVSLLKKNGCIVVTAGNGFDINFLPRLKSILELADAVMANDCTTGLAYAFYMGKPVYLYKQIINVDGDNRLNEGMIEKNTKYIEEMYKICDDSFSKLSEQQEWGKYMFGIDRVMTRNELKSIIAPLVKKYV